VQAWDVVAAVDATATADRAQALTAGTVARVGNEGERSVQRSGPEVVTAVLGDLTRRVAGSTRDAAEGALDELSLR